MLKALDARGLVARTRMGVTHDGKVILYGRQTKLQHLLNLVRACHTFDVHGAP